MRSRIWLPVRSGTGWDHPPTITGVAAGRSISTPVCYGMGPRRTSNATRCCSRHGCAARPRCCGSPAGDAPALEAPNDRRVQHGCVEGTPWMRIAAGRGGVVAAARDSQQASQTLDRYVAYRSSSARLPAPAVAISAANRAAAVGFDRLLAEHRPAWARRWEAGRRGHRGRRRAAARGPLRAVPADGVGRRPW